MMKNIIAKGFFVLLITFMISSQCLAGTPAVSNMSSYITVLPETSVSPGIHPGSTVVITGSIKAPLEDLKGVVLFPNLWTPNWQMSHLTEVMIGNVAKGATAPFTITYQIPAGAKLGKYQLDLSFVVGQPSIWPSYAQIYDFTVAQAPSAPSSISMTSALPMPPSPVVGTGTNWYVSPTGSASLSSAGHTPLEPISLNALSTAEWMQNVIKPGDTVWVMDGTYTNSSNCSYVFNITNSGTPTAWITFKAYPGAHPVIQMGNEGCAGFNVNASYIVIDGFEIEGVAQSVTYAQANADYQAQNHNDPKMIQNGIYVNTPSGAPPYFSHIVIQNCKIHDVGGAGIGISTYDYVTIQNNVIYDTSWWSPWATSGISLHEMRNADNSTTGYRNVIENNVLYNNQEYIPFFELSNPYITDGNGIILDDTKNTQSKGQYAVPYNGRTLIANNTVYNNGGSGIHAYISEHADIINNTAYLNNQSPNINEGQIFAQGSDDVNILNNIMVAPTGKESTSNVSNAANVLYDYNLYYALGGTVTLGGAPKSAHDVVADPLFVNTAEANFELSKGSPAIGIGTSYLAPAYDANNVPRPLGSGVDIGAFQ